MTTDLETGGIRVHLPREWSDITAEVDVPDPPLTLARPDGGALQFSIARYADGDEPDATIESLEEMIERFVVAEDLGVEQPEGRGAWNEAEIFGVARSFIEAASSEHTRVWYVSDGSNFALVTYCIELPDPGELDEAEQIVRSIRFTTGTQRT